MKDTIEVFRCEKIPSLKGEVRPSGSKNSSLKLMSVSLLFDGPIHLSHVPNNNQIKFAVDVVQEIGSTVLLDIEEDPPGLSLRIETSDIKRSEILNDEVNWCRHVFLMSLPILLRTGKVTVPIPGYSHYGPRPVSAQLTALTSMGAKVGNLLDGRVTITLPSEGLKATEFALSYPSVAATEAILISAVAAKGKTVISGAAQEPEISDIGEFLRKSGVEIKGLGTTEIIVESDGLSSLKQEIEWQCIPDRIEISTFGAAVATCGGQITIRNVINHHLAPIRAVLTRMGCNIKIDDSDWTISASGRSHSTDIVTRPFPGFPTDSQGPFLTALARADGVSVMHETIWPNRLAQAMELRKMGANIDVYQGNLAVVKGISELIGTKVVGTDPRAAAGLVIAGLVANGETIVFGTDLVDNAYDAFDVKLRNLGAKIRRETIEAREYPRIHPKYLRLEAQ